MFYTITFKADGTPVEAASYSHAPEALPEGAVNVTAEAFAKWQTRRRKADGTIVEDLSLAPTPVKIRVYKADVWRNATDQEAEKLAAKLASQSVRMRNWWSDARYLETTDPVFAVVRQAFVEAIGQARADALLMPTE